MGFHFVNPGLIALEEDGPFDLENPPILVYFTTGNYNVGDGDIHDPDRDEDLRLGAAEYAHEGTKGAPGNIFSDEEASRNVKFPEEEGWEPVPGTPFTALHVWVHRGNPAGVFHPTNPTTD